MNSSSSSVSEAQRWENYRRANSQKPHVRENELRKIFELATPRPGERIWEVGTGNGYLTFPLALAVGEGGLVVTTDVERGNSKDVEDKNKKLRLRIEPLLLPAEDPLLGPKYKNEFDAVVSIATLHHLDNRAKQTGEKGRTRAFKVFYRALKPGGRIALSDILHDTITQRYFDAIDSPRYCHPHGHPHDFFTGERLVDAVTQAGFRDVSMEVLSVPWQFSTKDEAKEFVHTIHNAICSPEESFAVAEKILGCKKGSNGYKLGWELFFLTARK